ncbi:MAG: phosphoenolpyruvate--protein phosphotransferase [Gemmatimonadaceae bacterium]
MARTLKGISASPGIVVGPVHVLLWEVPEVPHRIIPTDAIPSEIERFHRALDSSRERLRLIRERVSTRTGPEEGAIFDAQLLILEDGELINRVETLIRQNLAAETAFDLILLEWRQHFARHAVPMMRERVGDIADVQIRVLSLLMGLPDHDPVDVPKGSNAILVTHDLTPSLTVQLDRDAISAIATDAGTRISHVAILARSLGIPAVVGLRDATSRVRGGEQAVLDGAAGTLSIEPSADDIQDYLARDRAAVQVTAELSLLAFAEPITLDRVRVILRVNVDLPEEADRAAHSGADGVGLMRTEFLVIGRTTMPDEEEQYETYRGVVESFAGAPVVIRTYDIGGDKLPVGGFPSEPNPFLGWRAIRMCLDEPEIFKTQLRALLRAGVHGDVRIMLPLIVSVEEVRQARALLEEAANELATRGASFRRDVPLGVMIETPAAAVAVDSFVSDAAFFSIGTNDLVQYTLAVDRGNASMASRFTALHPAVLRLIEHTVSVGHSHGLEVGVCGEMASQPLMAFALIGLGVRQLSVNPGAVPLVKRLIRGMHASEAAKAANAALAAGTAAEATDILNSRFAEMFRNDPVLSDWLPARA